MHLDHFQGWWPHNAHINFMGLTVQLMEWITPISFFFYPTLKSQKEENSALLQTDSFSLLSKNMQRICYKLDIAEATDHSREACTTKINAPRLLHVMSCTVFLWLFVIPLMEVVCLKCDLAIGKNSVESLSLETSPYKPTFSQKELLFSFRTQR